MPAIADVPRIPCQRAVVINSSSTVVRRGVFRIISDLEGSCDSRIALPIQEGRCADSPLRLPSQPHTSQRL